MARRSIGARARLVAWLPACLVAGLPPRIKRSGPCPDHALILDGPQRAVVHELLNHLAVQCEIEPFALGVLRYPKTDEHLDHEQDDQADDGIVDKDGRNADALIEELTDIALQDAGRSAILLDREHPGEQRADHAADRVDAETIERVVVAEQPLQPGASPIAEHARGDADRKRADRPDKARRRRNGDEARDRARADADN